MTFEEMDRAMIQVRDNMVVQRELLHRLETDMVASRRDFDERIGILTRIAEDHERRLGDDREQLRKMQAAMEKLFERMDRFIRGLESDGHKKE
jgi:hypothetical protein